MERKDKISVLETIKTTSGKFLADAKVFLFGSRARNDHDIDSDYDILLVTETDLTPDQKMPLRTKIRKELLLAGIRSDILIESTKDINVKKNLPGHIIKSITREAVLI